MVGSPKTARRGVFRAGHQRYRAPPDRLRTAPSYERLRQLAKLAGRHPREQAAIYLEEAVRQAQMPPAEHDLIESGSPAAARPA